MSETTGEAILGEAQGGATMKVEQVYWPSVVWVTASQPLQQAVWRMREFDVGCLVVFEEGAVVGILTEHDVLRASAERVDPRDVLVRDYMTRDPRGIGIEDDVAEAAAVMMTARARHLPVVANGRVVGICSARDLLVPLSDGQETPRMGEELGASSM
jgi:CBS domain-containing protein